MYAGSLPSLGPDPLRPLAEVRETVIAETPGSSTGVPSRDHLPTYGDVNLDERFLPDPYEVSLTAGGGTDVDVGSCNYGYVAERPDVDFYYTTSGDVDLYLYVICAEDTTLLVDQPEGRWVCDDDDLCNSNPVVVIPSAADGLYNIWVGTYSAANTDATLYISEIDRR
jgi:hypothetical protein